MTTPSVTIRVNYKDWMQLRKIFPAMENESVAAYLQRYIQAIKDASRLE